MSRSLALIVLFIPGIIAAFGIKLMRDALFSEFYPIFLHTGVQFVAGLLFFIAGLGFIGGFIVYRDRKRQKNKEQTKKMDK
ncbi:DUF2627 domain-containing protein [Oceanobacillus sp. M65]|uniref:DUF2627 domain-containing protein n=1 Tax=Oceanobacillus jordanicus TaxID=2867266 RepID=A0AAW5B5B8_9BACI|nr:DUF2627 domain-containing protein [Oceanobacillus jordanicus]MCG3418754.1 DUF2627 domain-containing protein [Oceanobacillus jordanicus]